MRIAVWPVAALAGTLAFNTWAGQSQDPWVGTWKLNPAESKYRPGPAPISTVTTIESWEGGLKYTVDVVTSDGESRHIEWHGKFDGKDNPVEGNPDVDTNVLKRINKHSYRVIAKKDGKIVSVTKNVISHDGQRRTATLTGMNAELTQGSGVNDIAVFDRQ